MLLPVHLLGDICEDTDDVVDFFVFRVVDAVGDPIGAERAVGAGELHALLVSLRGHGLQEVLAGFLLPVFFVAGFREVLNQLRQAHEMGAGGGEPHAVLAHIKDKGAEVCESQQLIHAVLELPLPLQHLMEIPDGAQQGKDPEDEEAKEEQGDMDFCRYHDTPFFLRRYPAKSH